MSTAATRAQHRVLLGHLVEYDPALLAYAVHPKLVPLVEEVVGGTVRLEESEAIINRRNPEASPASLVSGAGLQFHDGTRHGWGTWEEQGNFHCLFVKTLAYLTDVGPDDGGTSVIPGSHKLSWPPQESIAAALADGRLIHQIEAKAGSVLLFPESLLHSTTPIRSDTERGNPGGRLHTANAARVARQRDQSRVRGHAPGAPAPPHLWQR